MAKTLTSRLVMEVIDRVTGPASRMRGTITGITADVRRMHGTFNGQINAALEANTARLENVRGSLFDATVAAYAWTAALRAPITSAMDLEDAMADVQKTTGATREEIAALRSEFIDMSKEIPLSAGEIASIGAAAGQAGVPMNELGTFTRDTAQAAVAFGMPADQMGQSLAELRAGLGLTQDQTMTLADIINHLSNQTAASAPDLLDFTQRTAALGRAAGFSEKQVVAYGAALISAGAAPDVAATSFNAMTRALTRGTAATGTQREAYAALGFEAENVARGMQKDALGTTNAIIESIRRLPADRQLSVMNQLFGDEGRSLAPLILEGDLLADTMTHVGDATAYADSVTKEYASRSNTTSAALRRFRNRIAAVSIAIGAALLPGMNRMMEALGPILDGISAWIEANPNLVASVVSVTSALVGLRVAMVALAFAGLTGRGGVLSALSLSMATVGRAAVYLRRAAAGAIALQTALASGAVIPLLSKIAIGFGGIVTAISAPIWGTFAAIAAAVAAAGVLIWKYWDRITAVFSGVGQAVGEILAPALETVRPLLEWFAPLGDMIASGWNSAVGAIKAVGEWLGSVFKKETLSEDDKAKAKQAGYDFVMSLWDGMKQVMADLLAWLSDKAAAIIAPFTGLGSKISGLFGGGVGAESFKEDFGIDGQRAKGGPISKGGRYLVGEEGPELITASRSGYVNSNGRGGSGGGAALTFHNSIVVNANGDAAVIASDVVRQIEQKTREAFRGVFADTGIATYG
jgi:TP901 family phage tail tape measure protein